MSTLNHDVKNWLELRLKTAGFIHSNEDKTPRPGMHVRQQGYAADNGKLAGVIAVFDGGEVAIIGHGWTPPTNDRVFSWRGSLEEFNKEWEID